MGIFTTSKTQVFIAPPLATGINPADLAAYVALTTFVPIRSFENIGDIGDTSSTVTFDDIGEGRTIKLKGQDDAGDFALTCAIDDADVGQQLLITAQEDKSTADYHFKIILPNRLTASGQPGLRFFSGKVFSQRESFGTANNVAKFSPSVGVTTKIFRKLATAGA